MLSEISKNIRKKTTIVQDYRNMSDSSKHIMQKQQKKKAPMPEINAPDAKELIGLWDELEALAPSHETVTAGDTERALASVHQRIESLQHEKPAKVYWIYRYLAAALILIAFGMGYLLFPIKKDVPFGTTASVLLPDGSEVQMNSGSTLAYNRLFGITNRNLTFEGEAFFDVVSGDKPFKIRSNGAITEVLGTSFNVRSWSDDPGSATTVTVLSGQVRFYPSTNDGAGVMLTAGLSSQWRPGIGSPSEPVTATLENVLAWRSRNLAFMNQPLSVIFRELERKFDLRIEYENGLIGNTLLTTYYSSPVELETVLNDIATVKGLSYYKTNNGYRIIQN